MDCLHGTHCNCIIHLTNVRVMEKEKDSYEEKISKFEKYINMVWGVLARNWGKLIVLSVLTIIVWFCYLVKNEVENPPSVDYYPAETSPEDTSTMYDDSVY